jgi:multidrug resistance efflux pump
LQNSTLRNSKKRLAELQAALGVNAERLALAETELGRSKRLAATGAATGKELEQASADAAVLRAEAAKLQAEIQTVEWQIEQTMVRAPVDGIIFERLASVGSFIYSDSKRDWHESCCPMSCVFCRFSLS